MDKYILKQAFRISTPIFFGYIAIGIPFGLMIVNAGYPWWIAPFMSVTMYAGAGQYVAATLFASGAALAEILVTELFVNIRHIVYGLSLIDKTKDAGKWKPYIIYALTDETYAVLTSIEAPRGVPAGTLYGYIALLDQLYWDLGGLIGALACNVLIHYNLSQYIQGVDFALTALFVVILSGQIGKSRDAVPPFIGFAAGIAAFALNKCGLLSSTNIMFSSIILGVTVLVLVRGRKFYRDQGKKVKNGSFVLFAVCAAVLEVGIIAMSVAELRRNGDAPSVASQPLTLRMAIVATLLSAVVLFCERLFPFALFSKKDPPPVIRFIEQYIPSMIMATLVVYSLKDVSLTAAPFGAPSFVAIGAALAVQLLCKNPMLSIFGSTILYMVLSRIL